MKLTNAQYAVLNDLNNASKWEDHQGFASPHDLGCPVTPFKKLVSLNLIERGDVYGEDKDYTLYRITTAGRQALKGGGE